MKVAFLVTAPPADEPRIQTMFGYAIVAAAMGYETLVFLTLDAAMLVKKRVVQNLASDTKDRMREAMEQDVKVVVCSSAVHTYGIKKEDMVEGIDIWGIASFYEHASESQIVLTW
jgi:predicted peroxiredoxin